MMYMSHRRPMAKRAERGWCNAASECFALLPLLLMGCAKETPLTGPDQTATDGAEAICPFDKNDDPAAAVALAIGEAREGYICPEEDADWYAVTIPDGTDLATVSLSIDSPVAPIDLTYALERDDLVVASPDNEEAAMAGQPLSIVHGVVSGAYFIKVWDRANDNEDRRHPYSLTVTGSKDPDANEPNNGASSATAAGAKLKGYIAYRGDMDWYRVDAPDRGLLTVALTMPAGGIAPAYEIRDAADNVLIRRENEAGMQAETDFSYHEYLGSAGAYYVVVSDMSGLGFDTQTPYTLTLTVVPDPDQNEGNDTVATATVMTPSPVPCAESWSDWISATGYLASAGDSDWYRFDVSDSAQGLIDIAVTFSDQKTLPATFEASARLVYSVPDNPCATDQECQYLARTCERDVDCAKMGNSCDRLKGRCVGDSTCMPDGNCGAILLAATAAGPENPDNPAYQDKNPNRGTVKLAAPLFGIGTIYLSVSDHDGDAFSAENSYEMKARVARDTDANENPELFTGRPPTEDDAIWEYFSLALPVPVYDCISSSENCCETGGAWVEGAISYTYDQDWYYYDHPCPNDEVCMVKIYYELGSGPVDTYMSVYQGDQGLWYDDILGIYDTGVQEATSGHCGGLESTDKCYFAYREHGAQYYVGLRDTVFVSPTDTWGGTWDWERDQRYRFCIEKIATGCSVPPCVLIQDICNAPSPQDAEVGEDL